MYDIQVNEGRFESKLMYKEIERQFLLIFEGAKSPLRAYIDTRDIFLSGSPTMTLQDLTNYDKIDPIYNPLIFAIVNQAKQPTPIEKVLPGIDRPATSIYRRERPPEAPPRHAGWARGRGDIRRPTPPPDTKQFLLVLLRLLDIVARSEEGQRLFAEQAGLFEEIGELIGRKIQ